MESHRLIYFAGKQGQDKQHQLVEELFHGYFTQGRYIGDRSDQLQLISHSLGIKKDAIRLK